MNSQQFICNQDILYNILLHADIDTIKNICLLNKTIRLLCGDNNLWHNKFQLNNLPIVTSDMSNVIAWIIEYTKVSNANKLSKDIIIWAFTESIKGLVYMIMTFTNDCR